jgi:hypothetical protein
MRVAKNWQEQTFLARHADLIGIREVLLASDGVPAVPSCRVRTCSSNEVRALFGHVR